jgi:type I restriction enzyme S subunit
MNNVVFLGEYAKIKTGKLDANASSDNGQYPFFTCSITPLKIDKYSYDCECVLVAGNGDLNIKYYNGKFDAYQRTYIVESLDKQELNVKYLYYFLNSYVDKLRELSIGGVIKYIKLAYLTEAKLVLPSQAIQKKIVTILDRVNVLIGCRKTQIAMVDLLVKSQFVEMFSADKYPMVKLEDICGFITKGTTPHTSKLHSIPNDSSVPYIKVYNLTDEGELHFFVEPQYVDIETHNTFLARSKVYPNDVLMNIVGLPLGKFALVTEDYPEWNINQAIAIFRSQGEVLPIYLMYAMMQPNILRPFLDKAVGVRQINLSLAQCREL